MKKIVQLIVLLSFLVSCNEAGKEDRFKEQFDKLEKVFGTGNWRLVTEVDTTYVFFSREGDTHYKIFSYKMLNGDSVDTYINTIQLQHDSIVMKSADRSPYVLLKVDENGSSWQTGRQPIYKFTKIDSLHMLHESEGYSRDTMHRILPISTFLVRSKYDFQHGTNTANALEDSSSRSRQ